MEFKTLYGETNKVSIDFSETVSMTEQHHAESCEINNILARYIKTGIIDHVNKYEPVYMDLPSYDFYEAMDVVNKAQAMFDELPSAVRVKFQNDPAQFLAFVQNPVNKDELYTMGLAIKPKEDAQATEQK